MKLALGILALALLAGTARADEIYSYTGPAPADLSGSFTTSALLVSDGSSNLINALFSNALSWNFTDGKDVWTPANSTFDGGAFVNPDGTFLIWGFTLVSNSGLYAFSHTTQGAFYYQDDTPVGDSWTANQNLWEKPKGSWTMADPPSSVPEPSALMSLLLAACMLACIWVSGYIFGQDSITKQRRAKVWEPLA